MHGKTDSTRAVCEHVLCLASLVPGLLQYGLSNCAAEIIEDPTDPTEDSATTAHLPCGVLQGDELTSQTVDAVTKEAISAENPSSSQNTEPDNQEGSVTVHSTSHPIARPARVNDADNDDDGSSEGEGASGLTIDSDALETGKISAVRYNNTKIKVRNDGMLVH